MGARTALFVWLALSLAVMGPLREAAASSSGWGKRAAEAQTGDWRARIGTFRVGVVARGGTLDTVLRARPFAAALSTVLDMPVEIFAAPDMGALVDAQLAGRVE